MQWVRSLLFNTQIYLVMIVMAVFFFPFALLSRSWALYACHTWCRWVIWSARWMLGLRTEIRGTPPSGPVLVAAKHQSFLDIIMIYGSVPMGRFIMKKLLLFSPIVGQYGWRIGCVPVHRGKGGRSIAKMVADVLSDEAHAGQLIIYPQGTRIAPGVKAPYKIGAGVLYEELKQTCIPVAANVGLFWPKRGVLRRPGTAVIEYLEPIAPGLPKEEFMHLIETRIEEASDRLMAEAGFGASGSKESKAE